MPRALPGCGRPGCGIAGPMRTKVVLALTLFVLLTTGKTPGFRELRNPDAEHHGGRSAVALKRDQL